MTRRPALVVAAWLAASALGASAGWLTFAAWWPSSRDAPVAATSTGMPLPQPDLRKRAPTSLPEIEASGAAQVHPIAIVPTSRRARPDRTRAPVPMRASERRPDRAAGVTATSWNESANDHGDRADPDQARTATDTRAIPAFNQPRNLPGGLPSAWPPAGSG